MELLLESSAVTRTVLIPSSANSNPITRAPNLSPSSRNANVQEKHKFHYHLNWFEVPPPFLAQRMNHTEHNCNYLASGECCWAESKSERRQGACRKPRRRRARQCIKMTRMVTWGSFALYHVWQHVLNIMSKNWSIIFIQQSAKNAFPFHLRM